ncbi:hypothetical protein [Comamonas resistens]|uniref:rolling circle replication-associated protein n=1 Tax=Comamonas resistens TaxID=3046670 RepID=UPI0039BC7FC0
MERIITAPTGERIVIQGEVLEDAWDVYVKRVNGHREISFRNAVIWSETDKLAPPPFDPEAYLSQFDGEDREWRERELEEEAEARRLKKLEQNAQRAKSACRWFIKANGLNELLTLTYRENQEDRDLCKKHFKEWVRRMKSALGGRFVYCASFERQDRGAMHVHIACHKLPKHATHKDVKIKGWELGTKVWRSIVGKDNGMCFVGGRKTPQGRIKQRSIAKIASYVSKYITKDYKDAPDESNRYSRSDSKNGIACMPKAEKIRIWGASLQDMIEMTFQCAEGEVIVSHRLTLERFEGARYWLVTEPKPIDHLPTVH